MLDKDKFLTFIPGSKVKINEMLENKNKKKELSCWICRRKNDELINALVSFKIPTDKFSTGFTGEIREIKTKITSLSLKSKQFNEVRIPLCMTCRFLLPETIKLSRNSEEERVDDSIFYH